MNIRSQKQTSENPYVANITPLIDVIFLLMIFFLLTINLYTPEGVLDNRLPQASSKQAVQSPTDWETIKLRIKMIKEDRQLKIYLQERVVFTYKDLLYYLDQLPEEILIIIDPNNDVPYKHVIGVYNTCIKSKKKNIVFSVST